MTGDELTTGDLRRRQLDQEQAERDRLAAADTGAAADRHRRRVEKAAYLRRKLEERERTERDVDDDPGLPPAA